MAKRLLSEYMLENNCSTSTAITALFPHFGDRVFFRQSDSDRIIFRHLLSSSTPPASALSETCQRLNVKKTFLRKFLENGCLKKMERLARSHAAKSGGKSQVDSRLASLHVYARLNINPLLPTDMTDDAIRQLNLILDEPTKPAYIRVEKFLKELNLTACELAWVCLNLKSKNLSPSSGLQLAVKKILIEITGKRVPVLAEFRDVSEPCVVLNDSEKLHITAPINVSPRELLTVDFLSTLRKSISPS